MTAPQTDIIVFDGFDELDAVGPLEVLAAAGFPVRLVVPPESSLTVHGANGLVLHAHAPMGDAPTLALVPGGGWVAGSPTSVRAVADEGRVPTLLAEWHRQGTVMASVCTGAMLLAAAGITRGRPAVTNRLALDDLSATGADVRAEARVVDDGDLITCGGPLAGIDLAIRLVERWLGETAARRAAARLEHVRVGPLVVTGGADHGGVPIR